MFAHDTFVAVFGAVRPGELDTLAGVVRAALRAGYAIVLNEPGTKKPLCTLSAKARRDADREAQDAAAAAGEPGAAHRRHACGIHHALQGEEDAKKVTGLLSRLAKQYGGTPNIGIEPGRSRVVIVDMDTAPQRDAFLDTWEREAGGHAVPDADTLYTVRSPGQQSPDGTWAHSDGGHAWFRLPEDVVLPTAHGDGRGVLTDDGGWSVIWSGLQVLVPPSVRAEGPYVAVGMPRPAPAWLLQRIETEVLLREERERLRIERHAQRVRDGETDPVDAWAADTPWGALLEPRGWSPTGRVDTCSCPTWTAPGPHGSPKSATAHDEGCSKFDTDDGHAPLHVWTDNPPDYLAHAPRTLTKLTHEAYAYHEGNESAAVIALGLAVRAPVLDDDPFDLGPQAGSDDLAVDSAASPAVAPGAAGPASSSGAEPVQAGEVAAGRDPEGSPAVTGDAEPSGPDLGVSTQEENEADDTGPSGGVPVADLFESAGSGTPGGDGDQLADDASEPTGSVKQAVSKPELSLLQVLDSGELDGLADPDPLIYGLLDRGSVALLAGKFGTYKSFLALDWACHVATGRDWAGHEVDEATPVVYIAAEGQVGIKRRVRGWRDKHLDGGHLPPGALTVIPQRVVLETDKDGKATAHLRELVELVRHLGAGMVVFDTLSKSRKHGTEENSNSDSSALMALVIELIRATGATVLLVAHTGYSGEHTRGGSSQEDDADTVFVVKFDDPKSEDRSMDNRRVLHHRKAKDGVLSPPLVLVPEVVAVGEDSRGREITTLTLTTDPWEEQADPGPQRGPRGALTEDVAAVWFEDQNPPRGMGKREAVAWARGAGMKGRDSVIWTGYQAWCGTGATSPAPDDHPQQE